jgi:hypothetical protein
MRVKWEIRCHKRLRARCCASTARAQRARRGASGRSPGPWGSFVGTAVRTGARGAASSSWRRGRGTWAASCGGENRRGASSSPEAVVGIEVRTCSRWVVSGDCAVVVGRETRGEEPRPVPAHRRLCKPYVGRRARELAEQRGGRAAAERERKIRVCLLHIWYWVVSVLVGARRIQIERIPGAVVDLTSVGLVMVLGSSVRKRHRRGLACF